MPPSVLRNALCRSLARDILSKFAGETAAGGLSPPVAIRMVAESLGFQVVALHNVPDEFSGIVSVRHGLIGVNGNHHPHRQRFSVAHELAHIILGHPPERSCSNAEIRLFNEEADICASELLIPPHLLAEWLQKTRNVASLSRVFDVSIGAMRHGLRNLSAAGTPSA